MLLFSMVENWFPGKCYLLYMMKCSWLCRKNYLLARRMLRCKSEFKFTSNLYIINVYIIHDNRNQLYMIHEYVFTTIKKIIYIQLQYDEQESVTNGGFKILLHLVVAQCETSSAELKCLSNYFPNKRIYHLPGVWSRSNEHEVTFTLKLSIQILNIHFCMKQENGTLSYLIGINYFNKSFGF